MQKLILAGFIIINDNNEVLLLHRNTPKRTQWETPGGKVEENETPEQCAVREAKEELGVDVKIIKELGTKDFKEDEFTNTYIWLLAEIICGKPKAIEEKHDKLQYWSWEKLQKRNDLSPNTQNLVKAYFDKELSL